MPDIKCTVSNCRYYQGEECMASAIEVNLDDGINSADNSEETQCHTFEA